MPPTRAQTAKIHIALHELGLSDAIYRDILAMNFGGRTSSTQLSPQDAELLLGIFRAKGWRPKRGAAPQPAASIPQDGLSRKILSLWITLHQAGVVRDGSNRALHRFVKRLSGAECLRFCSKEHKHRIIETLKSMAKREEVDLG